MEWAGESWGVQRTLKNIGQANFPDKKEFTESQNKDERWSIPGNVRTQCREKISQAPRGPQVSSRSENATETQKSKKQDRCLKGKKVLT